MASSLTRKAFGDIENISGQPKDQNPFNVIPSGPKPGLDAAARCKNVTFQSRTTHQKSFSSIPNTKERRPAHATLPLRRAQSASPIKFPRTDKPATATMTRILPVGVNSTIKNIPANASAERTMKTKSETDTKIKAEVEAGIARLEVELSDRLTNLSTRVSDLESRFAPLEARSINVADATSCIESNWLHAVGTTSTVSARHDGQPDGLVCASWPLSLPNLPAAGSNIEADRSRLKEGDDGLTTVALSVNAVCDGTAKPKGSEEHDSNLSHLQKATNLTTEQAEARCRKMLEHTVILEHLRSKDQQQLRCLRRPRLRLDCNFPRESVAEKLITEIPINSTSESAPTPAPIHLQGLARGNVSTNHHDVLEQDAGSTHVEYACEEGEDSGARHLMNVAQECARKSEIIEQLVRDRSDLNKKVEELEKKVKELDSEVILRGELYTTAEYSLLHDVADRLNIQLTPDTDDPIITVLNCAEQQTKEINMLRRLFEVSDCSYQTRKVIGLLLLEVDLDPGIYGNITPTDVLEKILGKVRSDRWQFLDLVNNVLSHAGIPLEMTEGVGILNKLRIIGEKLATDSYLDHVHSIAEVEQKIKALVENVVKLNGDTSPVQRTRQSRPWKLSPCGTFETQQETETSSMGSIGGSSEGDDETTGPPSLGSAE